MVRQRMTGVGDTNNTRSCITGESAGPTPRASVAGLRSSPFCPLSKSHHVPRPGSSPPTFTATAGDPAATCGTFEVFDAAPHRGTDLPDHHRRLLSPEPNPLLPARFCTPIGRHRLHRRCYSRIPPILHQHLRHRTLQGYRGGTSGNPLVQGT
ncbi:hypothetical protein DFH09DRAFT_392091 [Mycena vulgaris]|nr:hypothetical protein DFH09DRAFT_392091 [Mycena vulgaris]